MAHEDRMVTIHLSAVLDAELRSQSTKSSRELRQVFAKYKVHPKPLLPETRDSGAENIWQTSCDAASAPALVDALLHVSGVEGAYPNPEAGLPAPD